MATIFSVSRRCFFCGLFCYSPKAKLPKQLTARLACAAAEGEQPCSNEINVEWKIVPQSDVSVYRFEAELDALRYRYIVLDDPETKDIDESVTSPFCDLPYVIVNAGAEQISEDVIVEDIVSGSDGSAVADVSGTDVSSADAPVVPTVSESDTAVSGSDAVEDSGAETTVPAINETMPLCICTKHCYVDEEHGFYTINIDCPACSENPSHCTGGYELVERELSVSASDGRVITVSGAMPQTAELVVEIIEPDVAKKLLEDSATSASDVEGKDISFAYDIKVMYEGKEFQPEEYGTTLNVSITSVETDHRPFETLHFHDGQVSRIKAQPDDDKILSFETEGFSTVMGVLSATPTETVYYWMNRYGADNDLNQKIYRNAALTNNTGKQNISEVLALSENAGKNVTIYIRGTYCPHKGEAINNLDSNGEARTVTIKRDPTFTAPTVDYNLMDLGAYSNGGTFEFSNVDIDASMVNGHMNLDLYAAIAIYKNAKLTIQPGTRIHGGAGHGIYVGETNPSAPNSSATVTMNGGEIYDFHADVVADNTTASRDHAYKGAGVFVSSTGTFTMNGGSIHDNVAKVAGAGIYSEGTINIYNGSIYSNAATNLGGGICTLGTATMTGGTVGGDTPDKKNTAINGSGMCVTNGKFTLSGSGKISNNVAADSGGGIWSEGETVLTGGEISNNTASRLGGGGIIVFSGSLAMSGGTISGNTATTDGGGINIMQNASTFRMSGGSITGNTSNGNAGGISSYVTIEISNTASIDHNTAVGGGGGICLYGNNAAVKFTGGSISDNIAGMSGGGIFASGSSKGKIEMSGNAVISNNQATNGGGIRLGTKDTKLTFSGGTISGNKASKNGGGIDILGRADMSGSAAILDNEAGGGGGGVAIEDKYGGFVITGGTISGNKASNTGISCDSSDGVLINSITHYSSADGEDYDTMGPHFTMTGSPTITDVVAIQYPTGSGNVGGVNSNNNEEINVDTGFTPTTPVPICVFGANANTHAKQLGTQVATVFTNAVQYGYPTDPTKTAAATAAILNGIVCIDPTLKVIVDPYLNYSVILAEDDTTRAYFKKGATGDGSSPLSPTGSMATAYQRMAATGGSIYMMSEYSPTGTVVMTPNSFTDGTTVTTSAAVKLVRYDRPLAYSAAWPESYNGETFIDASGSADITVNGLEMDGGHFIGTTPIGNTLRISGESAKLTLSNVKLNGGTVLLADSDAKVTVGSTTPVTDSTGNKVNVVLQNKAGSRSGRVVASFAGGIAANTALVNVSDANIASFMTELNGSEVRIPANTGTLTAHASDIPLPSGMYDTYSFVLGDIFEDGIIGEQADVAFSSTIDSGKSLVAYNTDMSDWNSADSNSKFGLSAKNGSTTVDAKNSTLSGVAPDGTVTLKIYSGDSLGENNNAGTITVTMTIDGYARTIQLTLKTLPGAISATVPLNITCVVEPTGDFITPSADDYYIENTGARNISLTDIKWEWQTTADELFSNANAITPTLTIGATPYSFNTGALSSVQRSISGCTIEKNAKLPLPWELVIGDNNTLKTDEDKQDVAIITYTIEAA